LRNAFAYLVLKGYLFNVNVLLTLSTTFAYINTLIFTCWWHLLTC